MSFLKPRHLVIRDNKIELDGMDISLDVSHVELAADGRLAEAVLHLNENHSLDLDLLAKVSVARGDSGIDRFLAAVDPERLERDALSRVEGGSLTPVMLEVLREYAKEWDWEP